jgi:DNA-binding beta-propeller fold protein YncE
MRARNRIPRTLAVGTLVLVITALTAAAQRGETPDVLSLRAREKEVVDADFAAAIGFYKQVVDAPGVRGALAAEALLGMGRSYERLQNRIEAQKSYERIVREFPDETVMADQARRRLQELSAAQSRPLSCDRPLANPITFLRFQQTPWYPVATRNGCWIFMSTSAGITILEHIDDTIREVRSIPLTQQLGKIVLTHDEAILVAAANNQVTFLDVARLTSGQQNPVLGNIVDVRFGGAESLVITSDDKFLFVSQNMAAVISVIDLGKVRKSGFGNDAIVGHIPGVARSSGLTLSPDGRFLYATDQEAPARLKPQKTCPVSTTASGLEGAILIIHVARAKTNPEASVISTVTAGCHPVRLRLSADGNTLYTANQAVEGALLAFDTRPVAKGQPLELLWRLPIGPEPVDVAVIESHQRLVVTTRKRGALGEEPSNLLVIDPARITSGNAAIVGVIPAELNPRDLSLTNDGRLLMVTNRASRTLQIIDVDRVIGKLDKP